MAATRRNVEPGPHGPALIEQNELTRGCPHLTLPSPPRRMRKCIYRLRYGGDADQTHLSKEAQLMFRSPAKAPARIPDGVRVYAVGDIHGRADLLKQLLHMIKRDNSARAPAQTRVIFLGDYIDRGPDSKGVIDRLINGIPDGLEAVYLRGNHEEMLLRSFDERPAFSTWTTYGGLAALASYGVDPELFSGQLPGRKAMLNWEEIMRQFTAALPPEHRQFFNALETSYTVGDYFFVHGGVRPGVPLAKQTPEDCLWIRDAFLRHRGDFGKIVVHGHTPQPEPEIRTNRIGIDTRAHDSGRLTALCLEGESLSFLAT